TWNIQGWLSSRSAVKGSGNSQTNIFSMSLGYYAPVQSGATARYSGDISSWTWTHGSGNDAVTRSYGFTYDGAHRLTDARYYTGTAASSVTNNLSERNIKYDRAGNITSLTRYDNSATPVATTLSYSYTGNRLSSIGSASYAHDVNGNMTTDGRRGFSLTYNLLGNPVSVSSGGNPVASYTFLSDGTKAGVENGSDGFYYLGSFTFNRSKAVESVAFGGGRIRKTGTNSYAIDYYITDHLGSVRTIVNASGSVVEQNDYYPFGTRHANGLTQLTANRWRYNGKEDQVTGSLGYLDYGARFYDPVIARWNKTDPRADEQQKFSPYSFCGGNPILHVDTDGEIIETAWDVASLVMGVQSFVSNVKQGKVGAAIVDGIGILGDAFAVVAPIIPGGISVGVAAVRVGKNIDHTVDAAKALDRGVDATKTMDRVKNTATGVKHTSSSFDSVQKSSRAARREVMRKEGIPTSQQPIFQGKNQSGRDYLYEVPTIGGGQTTKSVQQQTLDRSHLDTPHWEAGEVKKYDGKTEYKYGRPRLKNGKSKVEYDE
ncbi:MAG: RHS repeat-associated core domain-containing protein, partial [Bacteroidales bacterium]|nr:RHS repeat-associated core domain-containing protein [Bacteroidales bacterium]